MLVRDRGGLGAARIDHHDLAVSRLDRFDAPAHSRRAHQAPVRRERVGSDDHEVLGAIDVGDGDEELVAEHRERREVVRELVDRGRAESISRLDRPHQDRRKDGPPERVHRRVADVDRDRVGAVFALNLEDAACRALDRFVPTALHEVAAGVLDQRLAQAIRIFVQRLERGTLRADVAAAERVVVIAADRSDPPALGLDRQPTHRLAERAGAVVRHGEDWRSPGTALWQSSTNAFARTVMIVADSGSISAGNKPVSTTTRGRSLLDELRCAVRADPAQSHELGVRERAVQPAEVLRSAEPARGDDRDEPVVHPRRGVDLVWRAHRRDQVQPARARGLDDLRVEDRREEKLGARGHRDIEVLGHDDVTDPDGRVGRVAHLRRDLGDERDRDRQREQLDPTLRGGDCAGDQVRSHRRLNDRRELGFFQEFGRVAHRVTAISRLGCGGQVPSVAAPIFGMVYVRLTLLR